MFNDLGVYGVPRAVRERKRWDAVKAMRSMEEYTRYMILMVHNSVHGGVHKVHDSIHGVHMVHDSIQ